MSRKVMMERRQDDLGLFSLAAFQTLRLEALDLFDRSLAESKPEYLEHFLELQVSQEPPPLELLSQIAEDVHQRLLALRQRHFEAREHVRRTIFNLYDLDLSILFTADPMEQRPLTFDDVRHFIGDDEARSADPVLQESLVNAARLFQDVTLANALHNFVMDWLMALHVVSVRGAWAVDVSRATDPLLIH
ncbi:MAG TPA: hypothetical protein VHD90_26220 [Phototrophicaceae bacterium]|nr:hypothetical protein [Phototrophicaceae bacterium]